MKRFAALLVLLLAVTATVPTFGGTSQNDWYKISQKNAKKQQKQWQKQYKRQLKRQRKALKKQQKAAKKQAAMWRKHH